ncbi:MAG TPA: biotin/lipoyl-containing protein, partial [Acidimicrobiales bacterium]|nr:biotin/lipoyl-containing protein [Acidimicrobiales bacterium]
VEERLDLSGIAPPPPSPPPPAEGEQTRIERDVDVEVNGRRYQVKLWVPDVAGVGMAAKPTNRPRPSPGAHHGGGAAGSGNVTVPMQGTIVKVLVKIGDTVEVGQPICVLEAMKMENHINAESAGTVEEIRVKPGDTVGAGDIVAVIA